MRVLYSFLSVILFGVSSLYAIEKIELSKKEKEWLSKDYTVKIKVGHFPPFIIKNDQGEFEGITLEYIKVIFGLYDIKYEFVQENVTFTQSLEDIKNRVNVDIIPALKETSDRLSYMNFTDNYISTPWVIFTRFDSPFVLKMEDLNSKKVVVPRNYVMHHILENNYPNIELLVVDSQNRDIEESFKALHKGEADAFIEGLSIGIFDIQRNGYTNIKVAAPAPFKPREMGMGVRKDWPELVSIINKGFASIPENQRLAIDNKWPAIKYTEGINYQILIQIASVVLLITLIIAYWNRKLRHLNLELEKRVQKGIEENSKKDKILLLKERQAKFGELLEIILHQLNKPLHAITILSSSLQHKAQNTQNIEELIDKTEEISKKIEEQIEFSQNTSSTIKSFYDPHQEKKRVDVGKSIQSAIGMFDVIFQNEGINVTLQVSSPAYVEMIENEFQQGILNIIKNSEDALLEYNIQNPTIEIEVKKVGNLAYISIENNAEKVLNPEVIYDLHYTTKHSEKGSGIGLYVLKSFVEKNGGKVYSENTNIGFKTTLYFPFSQEI